MVPKVTGKVSSARIQTWILTPDLLTSECDSCSLRWAKWTQDKDLGANCVFGRMTPETSVGSAEVGQGSGERATSVSSAPRKLFPPLWAGVSPYCPALHSPRKPSGRKGEGSAHSVSSQVGTVRTWGCAPPEGPSGPPSSPRRPLWPCPSPSDPRRPRDQSWYQRENGGQQRPPHAPDCSGDERLNAPPLWVSRLLECGWPRDADSDLQ